MASVLTLSTVPGGVARPRSGRELSESRAGVNSKKKKNRKEKKELRELSIGGEKATRYIHRPRTGNLSSLSKVRFLQNRSALSKWKKVRATRA